MVDIESNRVVRYRTTPLLTLVGGQNEKANFICNVDDDSRISTTNLWKDNTMKHTIKQIVKENHSIKQLVVTGTIVLVRDEGAILSNCYANGQFLDEQILLSPSNTDEWNWVLRNEKRQVKITLNNFYFSGGEILFDVEIPIE